jgi:hypothetical protein
MEITANHLIASCVPDEIKKLGNLRKANIRTTIKSAIRGGIVACNEAA